MSHADPLRVTRGVTSGLLRHVNRGRIANSDDSDDHEDWEGRTWNNYGKLRMREYGRGHLRAKDLPHNIQDHMNTLPPAMRRNPELQREIFKQVMRSNTLEEEPDSPEIDIVNEVDDDPCPPFEFYYSNLMWHSDSVPMTRNSKLKGCDCYPVCTPDNKNCSCLKKQMQWYRDGQTGFNYDTRGRWRHRDYPVFECNDLCGCDEDCRNRVCYLSFFVFGSC